ncbi:MAG TPA: DUF2723 domain-containing protein [Herpetosiphonaceae bacterium]
MRRSWSRLLPAGLALVIALALYSATAARTITTRFGGTDGGELTAVALSGGVAHPPGYPTYLLLARLALWIPWGEPAARLALLSALCGALAVAVTTLLVMARSSTRMVGWGAGLYAGLSLALCERLWSQAVIVEVYALHLLCMTICALLLWRWIATGRGWMLVLATYILGLGLGVHLTLAALIPAGIAAWLVAPKRPRLTLAQALATLAALAAGLAVYVLLPIWAAREAVPSWGEARTIGGFWQHVSAAEYRYLVGVVPWSQRLGRLGYVVRDLLVQPGPVALLAAIGWGLPAGWRGDRSLLVLSGGVAFCSLLFAIGYGGADSSVYLLPWTWAWCVWAGLGAAAIWGQIVGEHRQALRSGLAAILLVSIGWTLGARYNRLDLHADSAERERVNALLSQLAPDALIFTSADADTFGAWYLQRALGVRRDVLVIDTRLLRWPWYREQLIDPLPADNSQSICQTLQTIDRPRYRVDDSGSVQAVVGAAPFDPAICAAE